MRFLEDQIEARESLSTLPSTLPSTPAEAFEDQPGPPILEVVEEPSWSQEDLSQDKALECGRQERGVSVSQEVAMPSSLTQSQVPPLLLTTKRAKKGSNMEESALGLIKEANAVLKTPPDAEKAYGCYVAAKLQQMEEGQRLICEKIIFQALHKGLRDQMTDNMHLCTLAHPPPPPATSPPSEPQSPRKAARKAAGKHDGKAAGKTRK
ncbi:hypothetical protein AB205_0062600 [Aquarana catesbeiana]|uniref:Uncharacterized protein n=1 Tax=Aquarana catesbeiana TaxID=8400 RepID=A0A2G9R6G1_AQUCT|nr:hypothetical protein AB205_0062600 [Aquarana catesbeiana]